MDFVRFLASPVPRASRVFVCFWSNADHARYARLRKAGGTIIEQGETACCYAKSEKSWIDDPAGIAWALKI
jgi:hypothetical protein